MGPLLPASRVWERPMAALLWLAGTASDPDDPADMLAVIDAEDRFDAAGDLHRVTAPTLVVAGTRDRCYAVDVACETARTIPGARLVLLDRGHMGLVQDRGALARIAAFLSEDRRPVVSAAGPGA